MRLTLRMPEDNGDKVSSIVSAGSNNSTNKLHQEVFCSCPFCSAPASRGSPFRYDIRHQDQNSGSTKHHHNSSIQRGLLHSQQEQQALPQILMDCCGGNCRGGGVRSSSRTLTIDMDDDHHHLQHYPASSSCSCNCLVVPHSSSLAAGGVKGGSHLGEGNVMSCGVSACFASISGDCKGRDEMEDLDGRHDIFPMVGLLIKGLQLQFCLLRNG